MSLPPDYSPERWLHPLAFEGLVGRVLVGCGPRYSDLFREDGFAKSIDELLETPGMARLMPSDEPESIQMDESEATTKHIVVAVCLGIGAVVLIVGAVL